MKKILFAAAVAAFIMTACNKNAASNTGMAGADSTEALESAHIAYINMDSLVSKYDMYTELSGAYQTKAEKAEKDLTSKGRSLERDMMQYQEQMTKGLVTSREAATIEENLSKKQQAFVQQRDQVLAELGEEEAVMLNKIQHSITEYLKEYNKDYRYGVILSTSTSGPVLSANPALDITKEVLAGLNKQYASQAGNTKTPEPAAE